MVKVKYKYESRKPIHELLLHSNCDFYSICHGLRDNRASIFEILLIRIFDLKIEGQCHKEQRGVLRHYMDNCVAKNLLEILQVYLELYVVHDEIVHAYICSAMLKIDNIHSTLIIFIKVTYLDTTAKTKARKGRQAEKMSHATPQSCVSGSTDGKATKTKHKKYIMVLAIQFAALLLTDERPLVCKI